MNRHFILKIWRSDWVYRIRYFCLSWLLFFGNLDADEEKHCGQKYRYCPKLEVAQTTHGWAGVHAVAIDDSGKIIGNFLFENGSSGVVLNVRNAPSPACTSSLSIANTVVDRAVKDFDWMNKKPFKTDKVAAWTATSDELFQNKEA